MMSQRLRLDLRRLMNTPATAAEGVLFEKDLGGGSVLRQGWLQQDLVFAGDAYKAFTNDLPANSRVLFASINTKTLGAYSAETNVNAVKLGLGTAADPDQFLLDAGTVTKNTKTDKQPLEAVSIVAAAVTPRVTACQTGGTASTVGSYTGTVTARLIYEYITSIASAP